MKLKKITAVLLASLFALCLFTVSLASSDAPDIVTAVELFLEEYMQNQEFDVSLDGWQRFIYGCGISDVTMSLDKFDVTKKKPLAVSFLIASGNPQLKSQPKYQGDAEAYLNGIASAMSAPVKKVKLNLTITKTESGYLADFAPKARTAFEKTVKTLAATAKKAFADKRILQALTDLFLPAPVTMPKKAPASLAVSSYRQVFSDYLDRIALDDESRLLLPALCYAAKNIKLDTVQGPESLALTFEAPSLHAMIQKAGSDMQAEIRYDANAKAYSWDQLTNLIADNVEQQAIRHRHGKSKGDSERIVFSLFDLPTNEDAISLANLDYRGTLSEMMMDAADGTADIIKEMPDYPAVKNPKSGVVSGKNSGTKCIFVMPKDGLNYCIGVYSAYTGKQILVAFSNNGARLTLRIPSGEVYFVIGEGKTWYGAEHLFGDDGAYMKTEDIEILGSRYYHTFTVKPQTGGNTSVYHLNYNDLMRR